MKTMNELLPHIKLRFNIEHPSFEECYAHGYECGLKDVSESENPFIEGTKESDQWLEGWWAGFYKEEPIYDLTEYFIAPEDEYEVAANDEHYHGYTKSEFITRILEISSVIAVSAILGYQMIDMVA